MHLNKYGWGLKEMLVLSGVLIMFLLIAIYYIYVFYSSFDQEVAVGYYYEMEDSLEKQALIYLSDYYDDVLTSDNITITRGVLRSYDLDISLVDKDGDSCSGYVVANKSRGIINVNSYIKCDNYMTVGYEDWRK